MNPAFNFRQWIEDNRHLLRPPVGNQVVYKEAQDFIVMVVGGPNGRQDYHVNPTEEWFYQLEGDIQLKVINQGKFEVINIRQGDIFLLPRGIPHSPQRPALTLGLVLEVRRRLDQQDAFQWYCQQCQAMLYQEKLHVHDIVGQLPPLFAKFWANPELTTCRKCGRAHAQ